MKRLLTLLPLLLLASCASLRPGSANQGIYVAYATYSIALKAAADYSEGPTADRAVVARLNAVNKAPGVQTAVTYGRAYVLCQGSKTAVVPGVDCSLFDFRAQTAQAYAITLRSVVAALAARN